MKQKRAEKSCASRMMSRKCRSMHTIRPKGRDTSQKVSSVGERWRLRALAHEVLAARFPR